jgi:hypothetical protein
MSLTLEDIKRLRERNNREIELLHPTSSSSISVHDVAALLDLAEAQLRPQLPASVKVYAELLHRHLQAAREDFNGPRRAKLFAMTEDMRAEFPATKAWDDAHDRPSKSVNEGE